MVEKKRFQYNWKTGRMKDTQSNSQATSNMRILETIINDACHSYEKRIMKLEQTNKICEEQVLELRRLVHIATHNDFIKDSKKAEWNEELMRK